MVAHEITDPLKRFKKWLTYYICVYRRVIQFEVFVFLSREFLAFGTIMVKLEVEFKEQFEFNSEFNFIEHKLLVKSQVLRIKRWFQLKNITI